MTLEQGSDWIGEESLIREGDAVLATAEGGDRVLRMLSQRPRRIAVLSRHPAQIYLCDLKLAGVKALGYAEYRELAGLSPSRRRRALYQRVRWLLLPESDTWWLGHLGILDRGVARQGTVERRLASFRHFVRLVHGRGKVERFLALGNEAERRAMYDGEWQTFLWRKFGPWIWRRWFDEPADRLECLLFEGRLLADPPPLDPATFEGAKLMANRVLLVDETPEDYVRTLPAKSIDAFVLGRMDVRGLEDSLDRIAASGARMSRATSESSTVLRPAVAGTSPA